MQVDCHLKEVSLECKVFDGMEEFLAFPLSLTEVLKVCSCHQCSMNVLHCYLVDLQTALSLISVVL